MLPTDSCAGTGRVASRRLATPRPLNRRSTAPADPLGAAGSRRTRLAARAIQSRHSAWSPPVGSTAHWPRSPHRCSSRPRRSCTIRLRRPDHRTARLGPGRIPQCRRRGVAGRLHERRSNPADLHPGRAQGDLRAHRLPVVPGRPGGRLLRASVSRPDRVAARRLRASVATRVDRHAARNGPSVSERRPGRRDARAAGEKEHQSDPRVAHGALPVSAP